MSIELKEGLRERERFSENIILIERRTQEKILSFLLFCMDFKLALKTVTQC